MTHPRGRARNRGRAGGFTLIEILVVFTLIALIIGLVPLAYGRLLESAQYRDTVRAALTDMRAARQQAMAEGAETRFAVDLPARTFGVTGGPAYTVPEPLTLRAAMAGQEAGSGGQMSIRFLPRGGASGGSLDIIRPSGTGVRLRVDWFTGRVEQEAISP
ncbi:MAG: GspH/FimT family pseudopilin [Burkholderiaceae bacterium]|nr:GspH/FimT family pseudopilin [Burkholderiaceae bacterium]